MREISGLKFHRLYGRDLAVALEATFKGDAVITALGDLNFPELIYPNLEIHQTREKVRRVRVYQPAMADADMAEKTEGEIIFLPWVDETEVQFHRLVFRLLPMSNGGKFRWLQFGRFGEDSAFGFNVLTGKPYINLDFMSKRADEFVPLYVKIQDSSRFVYFILSAEACEEAVTLRIRQVNEREVPAHLAEVRPG